MVGLPNRRRKPVHIDDDVVIATPCSGTGNGDDSTIPSEGKWGLPVVPTPDVEERDAEEDRPKRAAKPLDGGLA